VVTGHLWVYSPWLRQPKQKQDEAEAQFKVECEKVAVSQRAVGFTLSCSIRVLDEHVKGEEGGGLSKFSGQSQDYVPFQGRKPRQVLYPDANTGFKSDFVAHDFWVRTHNRHELLAQFDQKRLRGTNPKMLCENVADELEAQSRWGNFWVAE